jgi:hypothetical protein
MRIIGCDLDASQQTIARISRRAHGDARRRDGPGFDQALPALVVRQNRGHGLDGLVRSADGGAGIPCLVGHPATIRTANAGRQKHDLENPHRRLRCPRPSSGIFGRCSSRYQLVRVRTMVEPQLTTHALKDAPTDELRRLHEATLGSGFAIRFVGGRVGRDLRSRIVWSPRNY